MTSEIEVARMQLRDIVHDLDAIKYRLLGVQASLPPGAEELDRFREVDAPDAVTILRTAIACVLKDYLAPLIHDLEAATAPFLAPSQADGRGEGKA